MTDSSFAWSLVSQMLQREVRDLDAALKKEDLAAAKKAADAIQKQLRNVLVHLG